jgi:hypothetical protein
MNFKKWLLTEGSNPGAKTGLYSLGYGGIGLYPPQWYLTRSADAVFYLSIDERIYKQKDHPVIKNIPAVKEKKFEKGDGSIWDITHLKGKPTHKQQSDMAANNGEGGIWDISNV